MCRTTEGLLPVYDAVDLRVALRNLVHRCMGLLFLMLYIT